ncbi:MAG: class I SAM-dependent methyltransferase [Pseudomonadota bacterium]|nr:class I SAM-dependent methyltransferase [Pseudomonadota bacterium]
MKTSVTLPAGQPSRTLAAWLIGAGLTALAAGCTQAPQAAPQVADARAAESASSYGIPDGVAEMPAVQAEASDSPFGMSSLSPDGAASGRRVPDVVFVPTPHEVVDAMLKIANVGPGDVLYDLGSGDGRIPIAAAKRWGTRGLGIDIDPDRIREANQAAKAAGVTGKVKFIEADLFETDLSDATVVTLYLLPALNLRLRPTLLGLKPGTRIVTHNYHMGDWSPQQQVIVGDSVVYFWEVPGTAPTGLNDGVQ